MTLDESSVMLYCLGMSKEPDLDDIERWAEDYEQAGFLILPLPIPTVLALVAECRELRRLRGDHQKLKELYAKEYGWKEGT